MRNPGGASRSTGAGDIGSKLLAAATAGIPLWEGDRLDGRTLLLHDDRDVGHTLRYLRLAGQVREQGGSILFACERSLVSLISTCPHIHRALSFEDLARDRSGLAITVQAPLARLPVLLGCQQRTITASFPYLRLPDECRRNPDPTGRPRFLVGLSWCLAERFQLLHRITPDRGKEALEFVPIGLPHRHHARGTHPQPPPFSYLEVAGVVGQLDWLITSNTPLAHLAGALGVSVAVVLPAGATGGWRGGGDSTPWYPTMRFFRQSRPEEWDTVWLRLREELQAILDGQRFRLRASHRYTRSPVSPVRAEYLPEQIPSGDPPLVSVIMPVWNGMRYLPRALASLRAQTHSRWEGLIIDDGSTDSSWEMLARAAAEDARIVPIRLGSNGGPAAARNAGLSRARGDWIAYLDCDDVFYPGHLGRLAQREVPGEVLVFAYDVYQEPGEGQPSRYLHTWDPIVKRDRMWIRNPSTPLGIAHRRDLLARVGLFDEQISYQEDWDLWKRMARAGAVFLFSPERSGRYHLRADGQSRTRRIPDALR